MKMRSDLKWIPSIYLESVNPNCTKRYCYKSLSDIHSDKDYLNKANDYSSRSCVSFNSVREEWSVCSIIDIINEFAPSHNVECEENDLYPSKARSQRWPLSKKKCDNIPTKLWTDTNIIINNQQITLNDNDDNDDNDDDDTSNNNTNTTTNMDDLWFAAGQTLELPPTPTKDININININHIHEQKDENDIDQQQVSIKDFEDEQECKYDNDHSKKTIIISNIINNLISIPFDDQPLNSKKIECDNNKLQIPRDIADGVTTRSSSLGSEAEINDNGEKATNYSSSNLIYSNEPSMSYIIDDVNTPIPPNDNTTNNTSALYEFLFDGVDTDTDDDDFFGTTMIEMNYRKSVPFDMDNVAKTNPDADAFAAGGNGQGTANEKVEQEQKSTTATTGTRPGSYVACRPLWELI